MWWGWTDVCAVDDVPEGGALTVEVKGLRIALFRDGDRVHALLDRCPHAGASMGGGWIEEGEAVCPLHRWRFRLIDGRCTTAPGRNLHAFRCEARDGRVRVKT